MVVALSGAAATDGRCPAAVAVGLRCRSGSGAMTPGSVTFRRIRVDHTHMLLELIQDKPSWGDALATALILPVGMTERRQGQDPWSPSTDRPRRISDDLAWLRNAVDEPEMHGLRMLEGTAAAGAWEVTDGPRVSDHLGRLEERGVLEAAGFLVHDDEPL